jgi:hypothetical protein
VAGRFGLALAVAGGLGETGASGGAEEGLAFFGRRGSLDISARLSAVGKAQTLVAAFFHLYSLSRDDTDDEMDTFPIVPKNDEKAHREYRTKRVILETYDEMAEAALTGKPDQTRLAPPPAASRVAPPDTRKAT